MTARHRRTAQARARLGVGASRRVRPYIDRPAQVAAA